MNIVIVTCTMPDLEKDIKETSNASTQSQQSGQGLIVDASCNTSTDRQHHIPGRGHTPLLPMHDALSHLSVLHAGGMVQT